MTDITPDRYQALRQWFETEGEAFTSETALTIAVAAAVELGGMAASGAEVDMVAMWGRELREQVSPEQISIEDDSEEPAAQGDVPAVRDTDGAGQDGEPRAQESTQPVEPDAHTASPAADTSPDDAPAPPVASTELVLTNEERTFGLDQRRAKAYALSGYWKDATQLAQALVKVEAGRELGIPSIVAMADIYVVDGKPQLGASIQATLVKQSERYDYRVLELTPERAVISFIDRDTGTVIGDSVFTMDDAKTAGLLAKKGDNWNKYPRNMLFSRAMTNGVGWFCPDVLGGRFYDPDELER